MVRLLLWGTVYAIPTLLIVYPLVEYDTGWHLATGRWILENHAIPEHDPFSTVPADQPWIAYSWLFGILLYTLHGLHGLHGILWFRTLMGIAIVAALHRLVARRQANPLTAALIVAAAGLALTRVLVAERPGLFSILFAVWTLAAIDGFVGDGVDAKKSWMVWLLPVGFVIWANVHIQFVHGLFLLGLGCLSAAWMLASGKPKIGPILRSPVITRFSPLILLCVLGTLVNPYHIRIYDVVLNYAGQSSTFDIFPELKSIAFRHYADWIALGMFAAACFVLGRRRSLGVYPVLLLAATAYFSFHSRHDVWLVVLGSSVILAHGTGNGQLQTETGMRGSSLSWAEAGVIAGLVVVLGMAMSLARPRDFLEQAWHDRFPVEACEAIAAKKLPGPLYNTAHWGGYLIWRLPEYRVSIDGRAQLQGDERIRRFYATENASEDWRDDPYLGAAPTVVLERNCPLGTLLRQDARYRLVHEDALAVVFTKRREQ